MLYLLVLIYLLFFAFFREGTTTRVNFIPFDSMVPLTVYTFKTGEDWWHWFVNVPGNVLAFVPLSLPLHFFIRQHLTKIFFACLIFSVPCVLEILQYLFQTGSCDVDDVLLNVLGIYLGFWLLKGKKIRLNFSRIS